MPDAMSAAAPPPLWGQRPIALERDALRRRIYAPVAYAPVRDAAVIPVVHTEAYQLAAWFPLVWRRRATEYDFVAVRALINDQRAQPPVARALFPCRRAARHGAKATETSSCECCRCQSWFRCVR
jgi:hypothetical protein